VRTKIAVSFGTPSGFVTVCAFSGKSTSPEYALAGSGFPGKNIIRKNLFHAEPAFHIEALTNSNLQ